MFKAVLAGLGAAVAVFLLFVLATSAVWGFQWITAPFRGSLEARERIKADGDFRIVAYDSFFNQCASIQALEGRLEFAQAALDNAIARGATPFEIRQYEADFNGISGFRSEAIAKYNADAAKSWTEGQFRSERLPYQLSTAQYVKGGTKTQCAF